MQQRTLLRRVLRRLLETGFEKVLRRVLRRCLAVCLQGGRVLRRGSKKGLSRRHLEGGNTPFREYDPVGVRPIFEFFFSTPGPRGLANPFSQGRKNSININFLVRISRGHS